MDTAAAWACAEIKPITDVEFHRFQALIHQEAGIFLSEMKRPLLVGRLARRMRELGVKSFGKYYQQISKTGEGELRILLNCVSTNETHFFREPAHFEYLRSTVIPAWASSPVTGRRHLRIWSAACSTGEEAYSIAMTAMDMLGNSPEFSFEVFASDISTKVLERAEAGLYPLRHSHRISPQYLKAFMLKGRGDCSEWMKVSPEIAHKVHFERVNLVGDLAGVFGPFDIIFCRNVLIYFQPETKRKVLSNLLSKLRPGGHLFLGHAETMHGVPVRTTACPVANVYVCSPE